MLGLRRIRKTDLTVLFDARNDPGVYKWCRQYAPLHWSGHEAWYNWQATSKDCEMFAVERLDSGYNLSDPVGVCGLTSIDYINSRGEFSLYIKRENQGCGFGREALILLFDFGFNTLGLNRIWGESFEKNPASSTFLSLGMEHEGVRKEFYFRNGNYIDANLYSISSANFNNFLSKTRNI